MNEKEIMALILATIMLFSVCTAGISAADEKLPFTDVAEDAWYYDSVKYVYENGLMNGTGNGSTFSPSGGLTRGMVVTVLYRMSGSPEAEYDDFAYSDVPDGEFYTLPVMWAKAAGVVTSTGIDDVGFELFSPLRTITRQELATMFVRYAAYASIKTDKKADISSFKDVSDVASWATDAMAWCNEAGLVKGTGSGDTLSPTMTASRDQFATIIHRFKTTQFEYHYVYNAPKLISAYTDRGQRLVDNADIYVAVDGNDKNDGSFEKPLATFEGAVKKVRELRKINKVPVVVAFKAGNYGYLDLELTAEDSGCEKCPITYCAYGDGEVTFSNGLEITLDEFTDISDSEKYLFAEDAVSSIRKVDLSDKTYEGALNYVKDIYGDYYFGKDNPYYGQFKGTLSLVAGLYDDEESLELARFPNKKDSDGDNNYMKMGSAESPITVKLEPMLENRFKSYHTYENIQFCGMDQAEYESSFFAVDSYDKEKAMIKTLDSTNGRGVHMSPYGYFQNISEELDMIGEYWIDAETETLYVFNPTSPKYYMATAGTLLKITDADHIKLVGLNFKHSMDEGIIINADNVMIDNCEIMGILGSFVRDTEFGTYAVVLNGNNNALRNSTLSQLGGGGVTISGGDPDFLKPSNTVVDNNLITKFGQTFHGWTPGVRIFDCVGATVSHNEISYTPHIAIHFDRGYEDMEGEIRSIDNTVEYNYIHNVGSYYRDIGAIYHGECQTNRDNVIRYNLISTVGPGAWGLYLDDGISGQTVYGNIFHNTGVCGIMGGAGRDNFVYDNYFIQEGNVPVDMSPMSIGAKYADMLADEGVDKLWSSTWPGTYGQTMADIPTDPAALKIWQERWPELFECLDERDEITPDRITDRTLMVNSAGSIYKNNFAYGVTRMTDFSFDPSALWFNEVENNVLYTDETDPQIFVNPALGDYSVKSGMGFADNHFAEIGRY